jgi:hypothetical protein
MGVGRGTEEATRGDYEYNPPDRSVAKSAHSVLPSIGCRDRNAEECRVEHSIHTRRLANDGSGRQSGKGRGKWNEAKGTGRKP